MSSDAGGGGTQLDAVLRDRLRQHEETLQRHKEKLAQHKKWLPATPSPSPSSGASMPAAADGHRPASTVGALTGPAIDVLHEELAAAPVFARTLPQYTTDAPSASGGPARSGQPSPRGSTPRGGSSAVHDRLYKDEAAQRKKNALREQHEEAARRMVPGKPRISTTQSPRGGSAQGRRKEPIEDRLLEKAEQREQHLAAAREKSQERSEEALARGTTFHPSVHRTRYRSDTPQAWPFEDYHASRHNEFAKSASAGREASPGHGSKNRDDGSNDAPSAAHQGTAKYAELSKKKSEALASKRRAEEGRQHMDIVTSLEQKDAQSKAEKWIQMQYLHAKEVPGTPTITARAHNMHRAGTVGERLHSAGGANKARNAATPNNNTLGGSLEDDDLLRMVDEAVTCTFSPAISRKAQTLVRKPGHTVSDDLYELAVLQREGREQQRRHLDDVERSTHAPRLNAVSAEIAAALPNTSRERLERPRSPAKADRHTFKPRINPESRAIVQRYYDASVNLSGSVQSRIDELHDHELRRKDKISQLRLERDRKEMAECTFAPRTTARGGNGPDSLSASVADDHSEPVHDRTHRWNQRKDIRMTEVEREHVGREMRECTFAPKVTSLPPQPVEESQLYGGDGAAWGHKEFVERQQKARQDREEKKRREEQVFASGAHWTGQTTVPKDVVLGRQRGRSPHQQLRSNASKSAAMAQQRPKSLQRPVGPQDMRHAGGPSPSASPVVSRGGRHMSPTASSAARTNRGGGNIAAGRRDQAPTATTSPGPSHRDGATEYVTEHDDAAHRGGHPHDGTHRIVSPTREEYGALYTHRSPDPPNNHRSLPHDAGDTGVFFPGRTMEQRLGSRPPPPPPQYVSPARRSLTYDDDPRPVVSPPPPRTSPPVPDVATTSAHTLSVIERARAALNRAEATTQLYSSALDAHNLSI